MTFFLFLHTKWFWNEFTNFALLDARASFGLVSGTRREFLLSPFLGCSWGESHMTTKATHGRHPTQLCGTVRFRVSRCSVYGAFIEGDCSVLVCNVWYQVGCTPTLGLAQEEKVTSLPLNCSRDALSVPLRDLDRVMAATRCGAFRPDLGRSGMMNRKTVAWNRRRWRYCVGHCVGTAGCGSSV